MAVRGAALGATVALALGSLAFVGGAAGRSAADVRVTVFGDSAATAMAYDPAAKRTLSRGIDLRLEVAACRRLGDTSCPYDGVRPPNVIDRATELGGELGPVVVVAVGYNDYEVNYTGNIDDAMAAFRKAGVQHVLWATLRASRQSYANMNDMIRAAAKKYPEITVLDWDGESRNEPDWLQPDGIHLTPSGAEAMAAMIEDALVQLGVAAKAPPPPAARRLLAISSRTLPTAHTDRPYAARLRAVGGKAPYRWMRTAGSLAPGLRLAANGRLTGVPTRPGTFSLRVRVVDTAGTARARILSLRVAG
jgi:putative Ig domain-containing protein